MKRTVLKFKSKLLFLCILIAQVAFGQDHKPVTGLSGFYRSGQVFLTWSESKTPANTYFNVYLYNQPITTKNIGKALKIGHHIEPHSACDWWLNPASFDKTATAITTNGFNLEQEKQLDPNSGLFVHTVKISDPAIMYFAVTRVSDGKELLELVAGESSLLKAIEGTVAMPAPIQLKTAPAAGSAKGGSLTIKLHGRGGDVALIPKSNFLVFCDDSQGWREGLSHKFLVYKKQENIVIEPYDRLWVGRPLLYSPDARDHGMAINTWWYGCNNSIYDAELSKTGLVVNYTENYLVYLAKWAQKYFGTDPDKTYIQGNSMGGTGALSTGIHHPEVFSTIFSTVPLPAYTRKAGKDKKNNFSRLDGLCGRICDENVMTTEGISVMDRMNSEKIVAQSKKELPFMVLTNGRTDGSMPWINNPSFYKQLNASKRGFVVYWNNGGHDMSRSAPKDVMDFYQLHPPMSLHTSYPAFSDFSGNKNPGNGEQEDGDLEGWMNRGIYWDHLRDSKEGWSAEIYLKDLPLVSYPAKVTVSTRNLQQFKIKKQEVLLVKWGNTSKELVADDDGSVTIKDVILNSDQDRVTIQITKK